LLHAKKTSGLPSKKTLKKGIFSLRVFDTEVLWLFGKLIYNTDMHLGNLTMGIAGNIFKLLPVYDMCSMGFAPKSREVPLYRFTPKPIRESALSEEHQRAGYDMARTFWGALSQDVLISNDLKALLALGNPIDRAAKAEGHK
jgi:hypothetical protein